MKTPKPRKSQAKKPQAKEKPQAKKKRLERYVANSAYRHQECAYVRKDQKEVALRLAVPIHDISAVRRTLVTLTNSERPKLRHLRTISRSWEVVEGAISSAARTVAQLIGHPWSGFRLTPEIEVILRVAEKHGFLAGGFPTPKLDMLERLAPMHAPTIQAFLTDIGSELKSDAHKNEVKRRHAVVSTQIESCRRMFDRLGCEERPLVVLRFNLYSAQPVVIAEDGRPEVVNYDLPAASTALLAGRKRLVKRLERADFYAALAGWVMTTDMTVLGGPAIHCVLFVWGDLGEASRVSVAEVATFAQKVCPEFLGWHNCRSDQNRELRRGIGRLDPLNRRDCDNMALAFEYLAIRDGVVGLDHSESRRFWVSNRLQPDGKKQATVRGQVIAVKDLGDRPSADAPSKADARDLRKREDELQALPKVIPDDLESPGDQWLAKVDSEAIDSAWRHTRRNLVAVEDQLTERRKLDALRAANRNRSDTAVVPRYALCFGALVGDQPVSALTQTGTEQEFIAENVGSTGSALAEAPDLQMTAFKVAPSSDSNELQSEHGCDDLSHPAPVSVRSGKIKTTIKPARQHARAVNVFVSKAKLAKIQQSSDDRLAEG